MNGQLDALLVSLGPLAVLIVLALVFAETGLLAGFFLPGDSLLFTTGLLCARGTIGVPIWAVVPAVCLAAVAGAQVGYLLGRRYGARLLNRPRSRLLDPRHLERARTFFERHGARAVVLARFVPVARTFTPVAAGAGRMPPRSFASYNVLGAVLWCTSLLLAGYLLGGVALVGAHVELITVGIVLISLLPAALAAMRRHRRMAVWALAAAVLASATLVGALADAAREHDGPAAQDPDVTAAVVAHRSALLTVLARAASFAGSEVSVAVVTVVLVVVLGLTDRRRQACVLLVGMAGAGALTLGIKHVVLRARPGAAVVLGPVDRGYSFPSGHTLLTATLVGLVVWLAWPALRAGTTRALTLAAALTVALVVGASRVYLGYHWTTDVLASYLTAAGWLGLMLLAFRLRGRAGSSGARPAHPGGSSQPAHSLRAVVERT